MLLPVILCTCCKIWSSKHNLGERQTETKKTDTHRGKSTQIHTDRPTETPIHNSHIQRQIHRYTTITYKKTDTQTHTANSENAGLKKNSDNISLCAVTFWW